jgi:hypothetical protein
MDKLLSRTSTETQPDSTKCATPQILYNVLTSDQSYDFSNLKRQLVNSMPSVALPTRADVVALCEKMGPKQNGFAYNEFIWIKYGECVTEAEAMTQQLVYQYADPSIVRTPAVYDYFSKARMLWNESRARRMATT